MAHLQRIMYIENKADLAGGDARIGLVTFSKTRKSLHYKNKSFTRISGFKANHVDVDTREKYWISGPKKDGSDRLYGERVPIHIDEDVREEYWTKIRDCPEQKDQKQYI